jgi:Transcription factor WhiB/Helix-turn-helix domain
MTRRRFVVPDDGTARWLTPAQVAQRLGVTVRDVHRWCRRGECPVIAGDDGGWLVPAAWVGETSLWEKTAPMPRSLDKAACRGMDIAVFFPGGPTVEAKRVCAGCPVQTVCRAYACAAGVEYGVWGGQDFSPRRGGLSVSEGMIEP